MIASRCTNYIICLNIKDISSNRFRTVTNYFLKKKGRRFSGSHTSFFLSELFTQMFAYNTQDPPYRFRSSPEKLIADRETG